MFRVQEQPQSTPGSDLACYFHLFPNPSTEKKVDVSVPKEVKTPLPEPKSEEIKQPPTKEPEV
eukprot:1392519-Amorphochlora_amoeboformis.AAC.2